MLEDVAKVAAKWWADRIREGSKQETGDAGLNMRMALFGSMSKKPEPSQIDLLQENLMNRLIQDHSGIVVLRVDYDPCEHLHLAATSAGIRVNNHTFPCKTTMWIENDKISVKFGYGARIEIIYPLEGCPV